MAGRRERWRGCAVSDAGARCAGTRTAPTCAHINRRYSTVYFLHPLSQTKTPTRTHSFPTCLCCCFVRLPPSCCESFAQLEEEYTHTLTHSHTHTHRWQIPIKLRAVSQYVRRLSDIWCYAPGGGGWLQHIHSAPPKTRHVPGPPCPPARLSAPLPTGSLPGAHLLSSDLLRPEALPRPPRGAPLC